MLKPGPKNSICDVAGITVGNARDDVAVTGVTVLLAEAGMTGSIDVRGGGPAGRETDLLSPENMVPGPDAICLSGGSAFGLGAGDAVVEALLRMGRGFAVGDLRVPIVCGASLYDLSQGEKDWRQGTPFRDLAFAAMADVSGDFALGSVGAGTGASAGQIKGGLGTASVVSDDGIVVAALAAVNPGGSVVMPGCDAFWAWPLEIAGEFGARRPPPDLITGNLEMVFENHLAMNTTLGVVATNVALDKAACRRMATMAHDGLARAIRPVHMPTDGDTVFSLAAGVKKLPLEPYLISRLGAMAADCMSRAIARGVYQATSTPGLPCYREKYG
jgi:L-aminopeptidase/D-esterase-like protein